MKHILILDLFILLFTTSMFNVETTTFWMIDPYHLMRSTMYLHTFVMGTTIIAHQTFFPSVPFRRIYSGLVHRLENCKCIILSLPQLLYLCLLNSIDFYHLRLCHQLFTYYVCRWEQVSKLKPVLTNKKYRLNIFEK